MKSKRQDDTRKALPDDKKMKSSPESSKEKGSVCYGGKVLLYCVSEEEQDLVLLKTFQEFASTQTPELRFHTTHSCTTPLTSCEDGFWKAIILFLPMNCSFKESCSVLDYLNSKLQLRSENVIVISPITTEYAKKRVSHPKDMEKIWLPKEISKVLKVPPSRVHLDKPRMLVFKSVKTEATPTQVPPLLSKTEIGTFAKDVDRESPSKKITVHRWIVDFQAEEHWIVAMAEMKNLCKKIVQVPGIRIRQLEGAFSPSMAGTGLKIIGSKTNDGLFSVVLGDFVAKEGSLESTQVLREYYSNAKKKILEKNCMELANFLAFSPVENLRYLLPKDFVDVMTERKNILNSSETISEKTSNWEKLAKRDSIKKSYSAVVEDPGYVVGIGEAQLLANLFRRSFTVDGVVFSHLLKDDDQRKLIVGSEKEKHYFPSPPMKIVEKKGRFYRLTDDLRLRRETLVNLDINITHTHLNPNLAGYLMVHFTGPLTPNLYYSLVQMNTETVKQLSSPPVNGYASWFGDLQNGDIFSLQQTTRVNWDYVKVVNTKWDAESQQLIHVTQLELPKTWELKKGKQLVLLMGVAGPLMGTRAQRLTNLTSLVPGTTLDQVLKYSSRWCVQPLSPESVRAKIPKVIPSLATLRPKQKTDATIFCTNSMLWPSLVVSAARGLTIFVEYKIRNAESRKGPQLDEDPVYRASALQWALEERNLETAKALRRHLMSHPKGKTLEFKKKELNGISLGTTFLGMPVDFVIKKFESYKVGSVSEDVVDVGKKQLLEQGFAMQLLIATFMDDVEQVHHLLNVYQEHRTLKQTMSLMLHTLNVTMGLLPTSTKCIKFYVRLLFQTNRKYPKHNYVDVARHLQLICADLREASRKEVRPGKILAKEVALAVALREMDEANAFVRIESGKKVPCITQMHVLFRSFVAKVKPTISGKVSRLVDKLNCLSIQ